MKRFIIPRCCIQVCVRCDVDLILRGSSSSYACVTVSSSENPLSCIASSDMADVSATPAAPGGCATWDALEKKHAADKAFVESKIAAMKKPRLGRPIPSAQIELQSAALRDEVAEKVEAERAQMGSYLAFVAAQPKADPVASASEAAADVAIASSATAKVAAAGDDSDGDSDGAEGAAADGPRKSKAQRRRVSARASRTSRAVAAAEHAKLWCHPGAAPL
jgi:hypothetical protein